MNTNPAKDKTILCLGDSYTIGQSVKPEERFPEQTVKLLQQNKIEFDKPEIVAKTGWTSIDLINAIHQNLLSNDFELLYTNTAEEYKTSLLIFGILPYFVTGMASEVDSMEWQKYSYARTLRMSNWQALYHVVIRGMLHRALEILRQNFAIAWMMITMVESANRENGGIGALLVDQNRFAGNFNGVFAIQFAILLMGILIHVLIGVISRKLFPYAYMKLNKK
ncbi:MAG: ABC transporter permease subunit [Chitinophagales bacterium]|nr:ABC transporter permease subunit [Bacteroidota bacterium]MBP8916829.1 ABC transporter permease subunit [Chitinophagales bacterium]MBP9220893.1 ABC transporter permease subunit [Chitinophagales bacterium]MBP9796345.1 ABC transporter permease subunit [Chitinophagales bacterium]